MGIFMGIFSDYKRKRIIGYLRHATPERLLERSERLLLKAFQRAARGVPAYRKILQERGVNPRDIKTIQQFKERVPLLDKDMTFTRFEIEQLCIGGNLDGVVSVGSSSGTSGVFSYSVLTKRNVEDTFAAHDFALAYLFKADRRKTLFINCMSMGQRVYTNLATLADTGVYEESIIAIIKKFAHKYEQTILTGNQAFIKKLIEDGYSQGIDWASLLVHVAVGGEWTSESWRTYIAHLLNIDLGKPETGIIIFSGGIAELFLHTVFHETLETIKIQRLIYKDPRLRSLIFGNNLEIYPQLFIFYPNHTYLEMLSTDKSDSGELVFSNVSPDAKIPLLRYRTYDLGKQLTRQSLKEALQKAGYPGAVLPELQLPLVTVFGRKSHFMVNGQPIAPEAIKEALYLDFTIADSVTGNFKMRSLNSLLGVNIQLKPGKFLENAKLQLLEENIAKYIKVPFKVTLYKYAEFPYAMRLDYERKFSYIK